MIENELLDRADEAEELARRLLDLAAKLRRSWSAQGQSRMFWPEGQKALCKSVASVIKFRKQRSEYIHASLFGEPAWDILLALFKNHLDQTDLTIAQVCLTCGPFEATARRWLEILATRGLVEMTGNRSDDRQNFARLTERGLIAMTGSFVAMQETSVSEPLRSTESGVIRIQADD